MGNLEQAFSADVLAELARPYLPQHLVINGPTRWYVARTAPRQEHLVVKGLVGYGIKPYLPELFPTIPRRCGRRCRNILEPMLPGYIFLPLPYRNEPWSVIREIDGILKHRPFLTCDSRPKAISEDLIEIVRSVENRERGKISEVQFQEIYVGKQIVVTVRDQHGTVSEFPGIVENITKLDRQGRIRVIAEWLGGSRQIEVRVAQIKADSHCVAMTP